MTNETAVCGLCGEPMLEGETMFKFHGYSGPCPKPPKDRPPLMAGVDEEFENWWRDDGRFIDPDTDDVPWFDKRKGLAESAFNAGRGSKK